MNERSIAVGGLPLEIIATELRSGRLEIADLLDAIARRIGQLEPEVRSLMPEPGRFERLRREAAAVAARWSDPARRPPLYGVPVGIKDIFHVDGLPTSGGSRLPPAELAGPEASSVTRLRAAGALVLGKTVSTEFAWFAPGPTRNPHDPERTPGGSSSGSAAAVGAGLCPLTLGSQTVGSVSRPAAFCGVVGFKPSYERIPRDGVIPLSPSLDHVGTFTTTVGGAALAAPVLVPGWRPVDPAAAGRPVLGVPEGPYLESATSEGLEGFDLACRRLEAGGYRIERVPALGEIEAIVERHYRLVAAEAARVHEAWYARYGDLYHSKTRDLIERGRTAPADEIERDRAGREALRAGLHELMKERGIELWISPAAAGPAPRGIDWTGDPVMNLPWSQSGLPTLAIPAGASVDGMPLGLQLAAGWHEDERLLAWGSGIEAALAAGGPQ